MPKYKTCPRCSTPRISLDEPCARCGHVRDRLGKARTRSGSTRSSRRRRDIVLARAHHQCQLRLPGCTGHATHEDHIVPLSKGGANDLSNMAAACAHCNLAKGNRA